MKTRKGKFPRNYLQSFGAAQVALSQIAATFTPAQFMTMVKNAMYDSFPTELFTEKSTYRLDESLDYFIENAEDVEDDEE